MLACSAVFRSKIIYTKTDEAPMLATYSLLPIIQRFAKPAGITVETSDISVAGRILAQFPSTGAPDNLAGLGELAKTAEANIVKLPNVSASVPQLIDAIAELQDKGYDIPDYPNDAYAAVLGSAVNPVLREGNSDRRVAGPVKEFAQNNPKRLGAWSPDCKSHVAHMTDGDFYSSEQSATMAAAGSVKIELVSGGETTLLKDEVVLQSGEVIDASSMSVKALRAFYEKEITDAKDSGLLLSLHLKATMMKISDPILFGHACEVYYADVLEKHSSTLAELGVNLNNGVGDLYAKIATLPADKQAEIEADIAANYENRPALAMVDSRNGITNLHVPSDVIIDASMPVVVRDSGMMWTKDDELAETKCLIPDRCYATFYAAMMDYCRENGAFDPATMGNVANVGLMAQKAEEYGSHDKTFEVPTDGVVRVTDNNGNIVFEHTVEKGDVWRMCQTKDAPIKDWVRLAVSRARATGDATIFWLNEERAHDRSLLAKVEEYLPLHDTAGLDISIKKPTDAVQASMDRAVKGLNTISVTGNVLRDYLTDMFPILELGTSAKMLSIVPLLAGGGLFETGAGGSAPKHVQQFVQENHLRWDSLGEYLALAVSLEQLGESTNNDKALLLGQTLTAATGKLLENNKSPSRKVNELDNRGSNFYVALYWAEELAKHDGEFAELAKALKDNESTIVKELIDCQGVAVDIGGYFQPDEEKVAKAMRPSATLNGLLAI
jgi:isocitrate dehydrogenase